MYMKTHFLQQIANSVSGIVLILFRILFIAQSQGCH